MATVLRYLGNCQLCEGDFKLDDVVTEMRKLPSGTFAEQAIKAKLVHHGYKRPGIGYIVGDCPGVHEAPYELTCDLIKKHLTIVAELVVDQQKVVAQLEALAMSTDPKDTISFNRSWDRGPLKTYTRGVRDETTESWKQRHDFESALREKTWEASSLLKQMIRVRDRYRERIAAWKPTPIRTLEEDEAVKRAARDARAVEVQKRRDEKAAKRAAIDAKHATLQEKRQTLLRETAAKIHELAMQTQPHANMWNAAALASKLSKKVPYFNPRDLGIDEDLVAVGLAEREKDGQISYKYSLFR